MFGWFKKSIEEKPSITPLALSNQELTDIFHNQKACPDCGVWDFREGPHGGMAVNIYCANCGSWFNEQGPFGLDRLFKHDNLDLRELDLDHSDNYEMYTWCIIRNWHKVPIEEENNQIRIMVLIDAANWCSTNDAIMGKWSIKDYVLYFEKETDAVAIKLKYS